MNNRSTHAEILAKVAKLLRLAQSSNPNEAALAASRAQELMDRWKLTASDVTQGSEPKSDEPIERFDRDPLDVDGSARWKSYLASPLAKANQTKLFISAGGLCLIGRASDVQTVRYIYGWLVREVERLASRDCKGCGRTYWNNYRIGAVETINRRLAETAKATVEAVRVESAQLGEASAHALMVVNQSLELMQKQSAAVEDWAKLHMNLRSRSGGGSRYNSSARQAGRTAGNEVRLTRASGSLSGGCAKLA